MFNLSNKYYFETTLFNYYYLDEAKRIENREITKRLFNNVNLGIIKGYFSQVVLDEIAQCENPKRKMMLDLIEKYDLAPVENYNDLETLAADYIREGAIPINKRNDALHLAIATINNLDVVVSWNCSHIVKFKTQQIVRVVNIIHGYKEIDVRTPGEVL
jgi:predicted nucleic acid-binding protein